jgi:hypothetical protein
VLTLLLLAFSARADDPARAIPSLVRAKIDGTRWVGVHFEIADGWHIYWENPGQSGLATAASLTGAPSEGPLFPGPQRFLLPGGIVNFGYEHDVTFLFRVEAKRPDVHVSTSWLVCHDECIPGHAELDTSLGKIPRGERATIEKALAALPVVGPPPDAVAPGTTVQIFPSLAFESAGGTAVGEVVGGKLELTMTPSDALERGDVVLRLAGPEGLRYVQLTSSP